MVGRAARSSDSDSDNSCNVQAVPVGHDGLILNSGLNWLVGGCCNYCTKCTV